MTEGRAHRSNEGSSVSSGDVISKLVFPRL